MGHSLRLPETVFFFSIIFLLFLLFLLISFFSSHSRWISSFPVFTTQMTASTRKIPWLKRRTRIPAKKNCPKSETSTKPIVICALLAHKKAEHAALSNKSDKGSKPRNELGTRSVTSGFCYDLVPYRFSFERFLRHYALLKTGMLLE